MASAQGQFQSYLRPRHGNDQPHRVWQRNSLADHRHGFAQDKVRRHRRRPSTSKGIGHVKGGSLCTSGVVGQSLVSAGGNRPFALVFDEIAMRPVCMIGPCSGDVVTVRCARLVAVGERCAAFSSHGCREDVGSCGVGQLPAVFWTFRAASSFVRQMPGPFFWSGGSATPQIFP